MYSFVICIYLMAVKLVSLFNKKVRLMVRGMHRCPRHFASASSRVNATSGFMPLRWVSLSRDVP